MYFIDEMDAAIQCSRVADRWSGTEPI